MDESLQFDPEIDVPDREEVPDEYRWDPADVFPDDDAWERAFASLEDDVDDLRALEGRATSDGETLLEALETHHDLKRRRGRLWLYAKLHVLADTTDDDARARMSRFEKLNARIDDAASFLEPAIQTAGRERIEEFVAASDGLETYDRHLERILERDEHTRSAEVESVLADLKRPLESPARILRELKNEDFEPPTIEAPDGESVTVTAHTIDRFLEHEDRAFRRRAFDAYGEELERHRAASARAYADRIESNLRLAAIRNYDSALAARLEGTLPVEIYDALVDGLRTNLEPFHRHLELSESRTDGDDLRLWDLQVPLVADSHGASGGNGDGLDGDGGTRSASENDNRDGGSSRNEGGSRSVSESPGPTIPYDEACEIAVDAVAPLGDDYQASLESFLADDRVDVYETTTKRSDARAMNVPTYEVGSYVMLNYKRDLRSLYYFVHELGHAMHAMHYRDQPTVYEDWPDHLVEIPSFTHEALLTAHLLESDAWDAVTRRHVLSTALEKLPLRTGAHWSAFVREAHTVVEDGGSLTADRFDELYGALQEEFLEPVALRDGDERVWLRQNLSRTPYFSYRYLLGMCGGLTVAERLVTADDDAERERYRNFLRAGTSRSPVDLLEILELDFASGTPVDRALETYGGYVDELAASLE